MGYFGVLLGHFWSTFEVLLGYFWSTFGALLEYFGLLLKCLIYFRILQKVRYMYPWSKVFHFGQTQFKENRMKECHRFSLRLRHAVILISKISLEENKRDGVDLNSDGRIDYCFRKKEGKFLWFSAD